MAQQGAARAVVLGQWKKKKAPQRQYDDNAEGTNAKEQQGSGSGGNRLEVVRCVFDLDIFGRKGR